MKKLLIIGHLAKDIVKTKFGTGEYAGGAAYHVAYSASLLLPKNSVVVKSSAGTDFDLKRLTDVGADVSRVNIYHGQLSDRHILNEENSRRVYTCEGDMGEEVDFQDDFKFDDEIARIHLASSPPVQQLRWLVQIRKLMKRKVLISADTFDTFAEDQPDLVREVMNQCDLVFVNQREWVALNSGLKTNNIIRKMGEEGAEFYVSGKKKFGVSVPKIKRAVDTTGAGEVVAGIFLASKLIGKTDQEALTEACRMATRSVENFGTEQIRL